MMPERNEMMANFGGSELGAWIAPHPDDSTRGIKADLVPDAFMQEYDEEAVAGALERLTRQPLVVVAQAPRGVAEETLDLCGVRRGSDDISRGAARIREEGGSRGGVADRAPPNALAARFVDPGFGGGQSSGGDRLLLRPKQTLVRECRVRLEPLSKHTTG
jgi:hypothetical protein